MGGDLEKECKKAAQILKNFVDKKRIPPEVVKNAKGLAIFSGFRAAMWLAGAGGSGVIIARLPDGSWSPPSAISVFSGGVGVVYGIDVYDCICVLNTQEAVDAYAKGETTLGAAATMAAGPIGGTADITTKDVKPIWTYTKSLGLYGGITVDGTIIKEKSDVNARAYGGKITAAQILKGEARSVPSGQLPEVLKLAEGNAADSKILDSISTEPTPGDLKE
ncbi:hypothetical protein PV08_11962 [Exophiala spinifera]|uniref:Ysc84 actin-binding domain-containing protein n=1 Tax=Exophiala spinifera TaxID=91928 RepID=A0A0D1Y4J6_9EURO|nr:uncharacterized protein PV08_11962 [Exophiala spinifera]KIW09861.1 hypothetical protein PV08_11962 [Exophiala spinifera]